MQGKHTGAIRGLGVAAIALSAVALLTCLFSAIILAMTGSVFSGSMMESLSYELMHGYSYGYSYDPLIAEGMSSIAGLIMGIIGLVVGWEVLTCIVSLIAGILGVRNAANPAKLGGVFGWGIAGAAAAFLGGRLITMGVLIAMAVLAKKSQDAADVAHWQDVAASQAQPYGHNIYAQAAPQAAAAPVQPAYDPAYANVPQQGAPVAQPSAYQQAYAPQPAVAQQPVALQPAVAQPAADPQPVVAEPAVAQPAADPTAVQPTAEPVAPEANEAAATDAADPAEPAAAEETNQ